MLSEFVVHHHKTGRSHFDLRIIQGDVLRSWSILKEPPRMMGDRRLAIERELFPAGSIRNSHFEEQAFGFGRVFVWDEGKVEITQASPKFMALSFAGTKLSGNYELRRMFWYPGNRWMLTKLRAPGEPRANPTVRPRGTA
jgi:DNA ligase D-like protein (predicted 3'-phosphoesterase)